MDFCDEEFRLPTAISQFGTCGSVCEDATWARQISQCTQEQGRDLCESEESFALCILEARGGTCFNLCELTASCEDNINVVDCVVDCLNEAPNTDELAEYYRELQQQCIANSNSCEDAEMCRQQGLGILPLVENVCAVEEECGLFIEGECIDLFAPIAQSLSLEGIECLSTSLTDACGTDLTDCFTQTTVPSSLNCNAYCLAGALCDTLPEDQSEFDCVQECNDSLVSDDPALSAQYQSNLICGRSASCGEFNTCLGQQGTSDEICQAVCTQNTLCGDEDETCLEQCQNQYQSTRTRAQQACDRLLTCEARSQCQVPPSPACNAICAPLEACGLSDETCASVCDDRDLNDSTYFLPQLACVSASAQCGDLDQCDQDPSRGYPCLNYCRSQLECADNPQEMTECLQSCGAGDLNSQEQYSLLTHQTCLISLGADALCTEIDTCLASDVDSGCEAYCTAQQGCGFEIDAECVSTCEADPTPILADLVCVLNAQNRGEQCGGVAACLGIEAPVPSADCAVYCDRLKECDPQEDLFLCHQTCMESNEGDRLRAVCTEFASCEEITRCIDADDLAPADCDTACVGLEETCGGTVGENQRFTDLFECRDQCGGVVAAEGDQGMATFGECLENAQCSEDGLDECFSRVFGPDIQGLCDRSWEAVSQCVAGTFIEGLIPPEADFISECLISSAQDYAASESQVICVEDILQSGMCADGFSLFMCIGL
jgi:hypothetical protein